MKLDRSTGAEEMADHLCTLTDLSEELGLIYSLHMMTYKL